MKKISYFAVIEPQQKQRFVTFLKIKIQLYANWLTIHLIQIYVVQYDAHI